jgi:hypothetical protein
MAESQSPPRADRSSFYVSSMPSNDNADNAGRLHMLLVEIDSAATMMAVAKISRDPQIVGQCREHALQTFLTGMDLILDTPMSNEQEQEVWDRLAPIQQWLETAGLLKS